jgi:CRISPR type III-B/RAMP module RAMP protein Cmr1
MENQEINLPKTFSFSEQIAIYLYKSSNKQTHYETYVITEILKDLNYNYEYHKMTFEFLVKRHENLRAYFKFNEDESVERVYDENYVPNVLPLIYLNEEATQEKLDKVFFEQFDKNYSIEYLPGIKVLIVKTVNGLFSIIRGHHCYLEVETAKILHREGLNLYEKICESSGNISYEEAIKNLPILPNFSEYIKELHENIKIKKPLIKEFLSNSLIKYKTDDKANIPYYGTEYFYEKFRFDIKDSETQKFITSNKIKPHQIFKVIHQIAIVKILGTNIPLIFNVNTQRNEKWRNHFGCQAKNHPFYVEVNTEYTLEEQVKFNEAKNKEMLDIYSQLDAYMCGPDDGNFPTSQYVLNFCYNNEENFIFRPDLRKETIITTDWPMNLYFELYYRTNDYFLAFYISKIAAVSTENTIKIKKFLVDIFKNLQECWHKKIKDLNV